MIEITLALPFPVAKYFYPSLPENQRDLLDELSECSGQLLAADFDPGILDFAVFNSPDEHPLVRSFWEHPGNRRQYRLLTITVDGELYIERAIDENKKSEHDEIRDNAELLAVEVALEDIEMQAKNLLLLANVLRPGAMSADEGFAFCDQTLVHRTEPFLAEGLYEAVNEASVTGWPPFRG